MKKLSLIAVLVMGMLTFMAGSAFAFGGPHQPFSATNNDGCAGCHVTHAAKGAKLLTTASQTDFCFVCHNGSQSVLDAKDGLNYSSGIGHYATAGGFNASAVSASASNDAVAPHTSMHSLGNTGNIPGGGIGITGGLQCGSCHNPHGTANARILKTTVNGVATSPITMNVTNGVVIAYTGGINQWCASCHTRFNVAQGSGHTADATNMYRHSMGVSAVLPVGANGDIITGTPLENGNVACLTCHRAHGSTANMPGLYSGINAIQRDDGTSAVLGSVLLRMDNRGVCFNCHNGATANLPQ